MGERLLQIVKQTGIFIVCAQMILHFKPAECYEKYIRLLIGIMVLAQLIASVSAVLGKEGANFFNGRVDYYKELLSQGMGAADMEEAEAILEKMTMEEVRERIRLMEELRQEEAGQQTGAGGQQNGTGGLQGEAAWESGTVLQGEDAQQAVEEVDIQIDRIEVTSGD